jgi:hypothetical protein
VRARSRLCGQRMSLGERRWITRRSRRSGWRSGWRLVSSRWRLSRRARGRRWLSRRRLLCRGSLSVRATRSAATAAASAIALRLARLGGVSVNGRTSAAAEAITASIICVLAKRRQVIGVAVAATHLALAARRATVARFTTAQAGDVVVARPLLAAALRCRASGWWARHESVLCVAGRKRCGDWSACR